MNTRKLMVSALSAGILLVSASAAQALTITNGSFETGDFTGWLRSNTTDTGVFGTVGPHNPTNGSFQAGMVSENNSDSALETFLGLSSGSIDGIVVGNATEGAAIKQTLAATAGEKILFDFNFLNDEAGSVVDTAFISLVTASTQTIVRLADSNGNSGAPIQPFAASSLLGEFIGNGATGYLAGEIIVPESGAITLGFGVVNEQDTAVDSGLLIDNVRAANAIPEPATLSLLGLGVLGLGALGVRRRRKAQ